MITCEFCGAEMPEGIASPQDAVRVSEKTRRALDTMKLALPDDLTRGVRALAAALPHLAGLCRPEAD